MHYSSKLPTTAELDPLLSIIILTWNSASEIGACLRSIQRYATTIKHEVLVIDNASADETAALVAREFPTVKLLQNEDNLGFAKGNNRGIRHARGRYLLLLNPDTIVHPGALSAMVNYLETHPRVAAVGPRLIQDDGLIQRSCTHYPSISTVLAAHLTQGGYLPPGDDPAAVEAVSGAALMVRGDVVETVGPLDTDFFMYGEDTEWCYRMRLAGWEIHYLPKAEITHFRGRSAGRVPLQTYVRRRLAKLIFLKKHGAWWQVRLLAHLLTLRIRLRKWTARDTEVVAYYEEILDRFWEEVNSL